MTDTLSYIFKKQLLWAQRRGIELCGSAGERGRLAYTRRLDDNLFEPFASEMRQEYAGGDGGELGNGVSRPGKMQAIHSSSALGCNAFHYWRRIHHIDAVLKACELPTRGIERVEFEGRLPISERFRYAPNLDVLITYSGGAVAAIECKFGEPFSSRAKAPLSTKYLDGTLDDLWGTAAALRSMADRCANPTVQDFAHLDVPQLLKHFLGIRQRSGAQGRLLYLFYDAPGPSGARHVDELARFTDAALRDGVAFNAVSYQTLLLRLADERRGHAAWVDYMTERYL